MSDLAPAARRRSALGALLLALVGGALLALTPSATAAPVVVSFGAEGAERSWTVPPGVREVDVTAIGGRGGSASGVSGGHGARVTGSLAVEPGQVLYVAVGGNGTAVGGWNGGGGGSQPSSRPGAGGGGATDLRTCRRDSDDCATLESRLIVAGGGGGSGGASQSDFAPGAGGAAGGSADGRGAAGAVGTTGGSWALRAAGGGGGATVATVGGGGSAGSIVCGSGWNGDGGLPGLDETGGRGTPGSTGAGSGGGGGGGVRGGGAGGSGAMASCTSNLDAGAGGGGGAGSSLVPAGGTVAVESAAAPSLQITYVPDTVTPEIEIDSPRDGAVFDHGQSVVADYSCSDDGGIESCTGSVADGQAIDTTAAGEHELTVTAVDAAGNRASRTVRYVVREAPDETAPTVELTVPADGAAYEQGQAVVAAYACADDRQLIGCTGPVASGAPVDTVTAGTHEFTVTATDAAGHHTSRTVRYVVVAPPVAPPAVPPGGETGPVPGGGPGAGNGGPGGGAVPGAPKPHVPKASAPKVSKVRLTRRRLSLRTSGAARLRVKIERRVGSRWRPVRQVTVRAKRAGSVARRTARLPAGRYRLTVRVTADGAERTKRVSLRVR